MKSIERRFKAIADLNGQLSDYMVFARAVRGGAFSKDTITRHFNRLVNQADYSSSDKKALIHQLTGLSQSKDMPEDNEN